VIKRLFSGRNFLGRLFKGLLFRGGAAQSQVSGGVAAYPAYNRQPRKYRHEALIAIELTTLFSVEWLEQPASEPAKPQPRTFTHAAILALNNDVYADASHGKTQPLIIALDIGRIVGKRYRQGATPAQRKDDELAALILFLLDS
jgi:hypothetical protein